uniref:Uncharacterized protein ycf15 n=1 Tax=Rhododendron simsii TaxID=118357 RepID=A0A7M1LC56_RHOSS|nr:hypothetical chloroplast RF15 [Rhododendron simsii]QOQ86042.1 hypothetical chloroplast RF15 [Rhododendron simsii]
MLLLKHGRSEIILELFKQEFLNSELQIFTTKKYWILFQIGPERRRKAEIVYY